MNKQEFINHLEAEITNGEIILNRFKSLQVIKNNYDDGMAVFGFNSESYKISPEERGRLTADLTMWERRVYEILHCYLGDAPALREFTISDTRIWLNFKDSGMRCMDHNITTLKSYLQRIDYMDAVQTKEQEVRTQTKEKPFKVFISHSGEDLKFVNELVKLLEFLGVDDSSKLLCSSIDGYRIPASEDFAEYIMRQFLDYRLFVIIVHSHDYYSSPYCLNEMGAAWVLKTNFYSFLIKGFDYQDMDGVINQRNISVKVDADDAKGRLNELKEKLTPLFKPQGVNNSRWETLRDEFLEKVNALPSQSGNGKGTDLFETCYIPVFEKIYGLIDTPNYPHWTFYWTFAGTSKISADTYHNLEELRDFMLRISYHKGYEEYDHILKNLGQFMTDYLDLCEQHIIPFGNNVYTVERFYKKIPNNPNYDELLNEFKEYCLLLCDMTMELTRLLNFLLEKIREKKPEFHIEDGILMIDSLERSSVVYRQDEKTDFPYPGLSQFVRLRSARSCCYSKTQSLDFVK